VFSHVFVGTNDFERALAFYRPLMHALGIEARFCEYGRPWAGWQSSPDPRPLFLIGRPFDGSAHLSGNGQMVAFMAADRETVNRAHELALAHGGTSEGAPGLRPEYHPHYYGAYFRDPDGNKLCVVCHRDAD
jgi:lactoylglutathione lyase